MQLNDQLSDQLSERFNTAINTAISDGQSGDQHGSQYGQSIEQRRGGSDVVQKVSTINIPYGQNYSGKWCRARSPPALTALKCNGAL